MTQDIEKVVEQKVNERLSAIESEKNAANVGTRFFLAIVCGFGAFYFAQKFGASDHNSLWAFGIGAVLGALYELIGLVISVIIVVALVKCTG